MKNEKFQMIKIASDNVEIINIYRSYEADDICFIEKLVPMLTNEKQTIFFWRFQSLLSITKGPSYIQAPT